MIMSYINNLTNNIKLRKTQISTVSTILPTWTNNTNFNNNQTIKRPTGLIGYGGEKNARMFGKKQNEKMFHTEHVDNFNIYDDTWGAIAKNHGHGCKGNFRYYLHRSTLHGMKYIGDGQLSIIERIFWFASVFAAVLFAAFFIWILYAKWDTYPMIVSMSPDLLPITKIPFPAITVCNNNLVKKSVASKIIKEGKFVDRKLLEVLCSINNDSTTIELESIRAGEWNYFKHFLINITQPCTQLLASCKWKNDPMICRDIFNAALTDEGICCTFNNLPKEMMFKNPKELTDLNITSPYMAVNWTPESGYPAEAPPEAYPWRPLGSGTSMGLTLVLDADIDEYYCSSTSSTGFKILLHNPAETPKIKDYGDLIPPGFEVRMGVRPKVIDFQTSLRNIPIQQRKCYFADEKELIYYKIYTQRNCALECETRLTIERCNCSQYYMPKNSTIRMCGMADYDCFTEVKVAIEDMFDADEKEALKKINCDECYPGCYELGYTHEVSLSALSDKYDIKEEMLGGQTLKYFKKNMAIVHVYYIEKTFSRYTKGEIYGFTEFLSNTGGILGLFMGFSFLSFVEILYFLSLRIVCSFWRDAFKKKEDKVFPFSQ